MALLNILHYPDPRLRKKALPVENVDPSLLPDWRLAFLPLVCVIGGGLLGLSVGDPGAPWPLPYLPVLNPLDLGLAAATAACVFWLSRARARVAPSLRSFHFWAGIPYQLDTLFQSTQVQAGLSVLWASAGLVTMVGASRVASRTAWSVGAALMVVVVAKLVMVDLASSGTIARIVSFISVGVLLMMVGYLAPVPPRLKFRP